MERWRRSARFLVMTQATGGHGLTLNECTHHIFYSNGFKFSERLQAEDRSHRIGQTKPTCSEGVELWQALQRGEKPPSISDELMKELTQPRR